MAKKVDNHSNSDADKPFHEWVPDVQPLARPRPYRAAPAPAPRARSRRRDEQAVLEESLGPPPPDADIETGEELVFRRSFISDRVFRKLRRGQYAVRGEIDLHGMKQAEARHALREFIAGSTAAGVQCVRVVHGKGLGSGPRGPVLKRSVNQWLRQWDAVLAFCSAPLRDGGTGAVYVLLKR